MDPTQIEPANVIHPTSFQVNLHCMLHRVATSLCRGHIGELATEPFLLMHRQHSAWNRLPTELKLLRLTDSFRRDLKKKLFHSV